MLSLLVFNIMHRTCDYEILLLLAIFVNSTILNTYLFFPLIIYSFQIFLVSVVRFLVHKFHKIDFLKNTIMKSIWFQSGK